MFTFLSWATQQTIIWIGFYLAVASWAVLAVLLLRHLIKKDWTRLKLTMLYALNSFSFLFAFWMILNTALIVATPVADTREHSIDIIWNEANRYLGDHFRFAVSATLGFALLNWLYLRFLVRLNVYRHSSILFCADTVILFSAMYLSVGSYQTGMLQEIDRYFLGQ